MVKYVDSAIKISSRVMLSHLRARLVGINVYQVYTPTADREDAEVEEFYHSIDQILK